MQDIGLSALANGFKILIKTWLNIYLFTDKVIPVVMKCDMYLSKFNFNWLAVVTAYSTYRAAIH